MPFTSLPQTRRGELYLGAEMLLWSLFPIVSILAFSNTPPILTAALATLTAGVFFMILLVTQQRLDEFRNCTVWPDLMRSVLIIGVGVFGLLFYGMQFTSAGDTAIFLQFEVLFTFLILGVWLRHEPLVPAHLVGAGLMLVGALVILLPNGELALNKGNLIILLATILMPIGNRYSQRALKQVSPIFLMTIRSLVSGVFLLGLSALLEGTPTLPATTTTWLPIIVNGLLLLGLSKIFWLRAITLLPISKCVSLNVLGVGLTLVFAYFLLGEIPTTAQLLGLLPIVAGALLLLRK